MMPINMQHTVIHICSHAHCHTHNIILHTWYMLLKSTSLNFFLINGWLSRVLVLVVEVSIGEMRRRRGRGGIRERGGGTPVLPKR